MGFFMRWGRGGVCCFLYMGGLFSDKCGILAFKINTKNIIYIVSTGRGRNNSVVSLWREE